MPSDAGFVQQTDWLKSKSLPTTDDIIFYPQLRYRGMRVLPQHWHPESREPLLNCLTGSDSWRRPILTQDDLREMISALKRDGWQYNPKDQNATKYIHVDELEKIEGPPPPDSF